MAMNAQRGAALLVSLLLLLVMTVLAVTAINMSTVNLRIVGNMQASQQAESAVEQALETTLIDPANFSANKGTSMAINVPGVGDVTVKPRRCLYSQFIADTSAGVTPGEIAVWEVSAIYADPVTNIQTELVSGIKIVMEGNGNCLW